MSDGTILWLLATNPKFPEPHPSDASPSPSLRSGSGRLYLYAPSLGAPCVEAKNKTQKTNVSVDTYLQTLPVGRRDDCEAIHRLMKKAARGDGAMWGPAIVGYGSRRLVYESGREQDWFYVGFASRKDSIVLYVDAKHHPAILQRLGKHKLSGSCLHLKRLADVSLPVLEELVRASLRRQKDA